MREMKDSGIEWIGEIPAGWKVKKIKHSFSIIAGATPKSEVPEFWDGDIAWITPADYKTADVYVAGGKRNLSQAGYDSCGTTLIPSGSIVFSKRAPIGSVAINTNDLCTNQGCLSCVPRCECVTKYFYYMMSVFTEIFNLFGTGTTFKEISVDNFANFSLPFPDITEQHQIVSYLDQKCTEVDAVIAKTKATIEEYKKLKQSIITEAVTKGIRGDRPMKDSGIAWVPKIAADWHISRIGLHYDVILGKMLCDRQLQDDYTLEDYFCAANVHFDGVATQGLKKMWFSPVEKETYHVNIGDLLVVEGGAGAGGAAIVTELINPTYIQNSIMIVRGKHSQTNRYLRYWIECLVKKGYVDVVCNKATIPHLTKDKLATMPIPVLDETEMVEIADYLDEKCLQLDALIARKTALLEEMESYKKSVIYEYVTGKKEV